MSMNQYMHPRNIYRQPPDFKQLALDYPEFRPYVKQDISGKVSVDFKNVDALRALTCTLLKKDFNIAITLPANKLIPTVPLRLNYILWVEDLLNLAGNVGNIKGIDIGTGASCIYPLIAARKNSWRMIGTEIDAESVECARKNIDRNHLETLIQVFQVSGESLLLELCEKSSEPFDFCMCNPPFFSNLHELNPFSRRPDRPKPKNAFCASTSEVVAQGGEVKYISKLINESQKLGSRIKIYTTMVGHKSSMPQLKTMLRQAGVVSFKETEFCQGNTTRWGLAWTWLDLDLRKIPDSLVSAKEKLPKPLLYKIPAETNLKQASDQVQNLLKSIQIELNEVKHVKNYVEFIITAHGNTWSHQRRKRREINRLLNSSDSSREEIGEACDKLASLDVDNNNRNGKKRSCDDDSGYYSKKIKTGEETSDVYLKGTVSLAFIEDEGILLQMVYLCGKANKEALHQVFQFIKNNFQKKDAQTSM